MLDDEEKENAPAGPTDAITTLDKYGLSCQPLTPDAPGPPKCAPEKPADWQRLPVAAAEPEPKRPDKPTNCERFAVEPPQPTGAAGEIKPRGTLGEESPCVWISEGILERIDGSGLFEKPLHAKVVYLALIRIANDRSSKKNIVTSFECSRAFIAKKADLRLRTLATPFRELRRAGIIGIKHHKQTPEKNAHSTYTLLTGIPAEGDGHTMHDPRARHARPPGKRKASSFAHKDKNPQRGIKKMKEAAPLAGALEGAPPGAVQDATMAAVHKSW